MALIAIKWDEHVIRVAVAGNARGGNRLQFDRALSVKLPSNSDEEQQADPTQHLKEIVEQLGAQKAEATVVVTRSDIELRQFQLPPVPSEELPDMVRFQARNQFTSFTDESLIDFVPLESDSDHNSVLAAALSVEQTKRITETVENAGLKLKHIVVRPFAAAELIRTAIPSDNSRVIVELLGSEADITVVDGNYVRMSRTVRIPDSYSVEQIDAWLPGEIRRTVTAARAQSGAKKLNEIVVCTSQSEHKKLAGELKDAFDIEATFFSAFDAIQKSGRFQTPDETDGFVSLFGSLNQTVSEENHAIDFLNPRKKPEPVLDRRKMYTIGGIAAAVALMALGTLWFSLKSKDKEIANIQEQIAGLQASKERADIVMANTKPVDLWMAGQTDWLEELHKLSELLPPPEDNRLELFRGVKGLREAGITLHGLSNEVSARNLINTLSNRPWLVKPQPTDMVKVDGFESRFKLDLAFPFSTILHDGKVSRFFENIETKTTPDKTVSDATNTIEEDKAE